MRYYFHLSGTCIDIKSKLDYIPLMRYDISEINFSSSIEYRVWNLDTRVWKLEYRVWKLEYRVWKLKYRVWKLEYRVWKIEYRVFRIEYRWFELISSRKSLLTIRWWLRNCPVTFSRLLGDFLKLLTFCCRWETIPQVEVCYRFQLYLTILKWQSKIWANPY